MKIIVLILLACVLLGPLRRPFLRHGTFTVLALIGLIAGYLAGSFVMALARVPQPMSVLIPLAMAAGAGLGFGESCKAWCDRVFRSKDREHD